MSYPKKVFAIFEGGGAKGVMHLATLRALQEAQLPIAGYAGTSAGAIVAALAAVGYRHDELLQLSRHGRSLAARSPLFPITIATGRRRLRFWQRRRQLRRPTDLLNGWWLVRLARALSKYPRRRVAVFSVLAVMLLAPALLFALEAVGLSSNGWSMPFLAWGLHAVAVGMSLFGTMLYLGYFPFLASLGPMERALNQLLAKKLGLPETHEVTFGDLRRCQSGHALSIVATNLSRQELRVFSTANDADDAIRVAQAVKASAAIPMLLKPIVITSGLRDDLYCDGGLVSNMPAWVFDAELVQDASGWVIASNLIEAEDDQSPKDHRRGVRYLRVLFRAALFGADVLSKRAVRNLYTLEVPAPMHLLGFDFERDPRAFAAAFQLGRIAAEMQLKVILAERQTHERIFGRIGREVFGGQEPPNLRSALVRRDGAGEQRPIFHLWNCLGFDGHADRHLSFVEAGSMVEKALDMRGAHWLYLNSDVDSRSFYQIDGDGLIRDRTPKDRLWSLVVPLKPVEVELSAEFANLPVGRYVSVAMTFDGNQNTRAPDEDDLNRLSAIVREEWVSPSAEHLQRPWATEGR